MYIVYLQCVGQVLVGLQLECNLSSSGGGHLLL